MTAPAQYLEAAQLEELAGKLEAAGYEVSRELRDGDVVYDLVAAKNGRRIVYEVQARSELSEAAGAIRRVREQAHQRGYDEFRLVVVNPPRERSVEISGLEDALYGYIVNHIPEELRALSPRTHLGRVSQADIDAISITPTGTRVVGTGILDIALNDGAGEPHDGSSWEAAFPFHFDVLLNHRLEIAEVNELRVDTSDFHG